MPPPPEMHPPFTSDKYLGKNMSDLRRFHIHRLFRKQFPEANGRLTVLTADNIYYISVNTTPFPAGTVYCAGHVSAHVSHLQVRGLVNKYSIMYLAYILHVNRVDTPLQ
jgi:hypothetical protein